VVEDGPWEPLTVSGLPRGKVLPSALQVPGMPTTIEVPDDLAERLESHCEEGETPAELIEELVSMYETEGAFLQEGYSE